MNEKYTYIDGKIIIEDEKGQKKVVEHSDKLDEMLIKENIIESLEKELDEINNDINKSEKRNKGNIFSIYFNAILFLSIPVIMQILFKNLLGVNLFEAIESADPTISIFLKHFITLLPVTCGLGFTISSYKEYKNNKKNIIGQKAKKKVLEETLEEEKIQLQELSQTTQKLNPTEDFYEKEIDYLEVLKTIKNYLNLYYDCGYNREKYIKYLQAGKLDKKLKRYYTESGRKLITEYLEENINIEDDVKSNYKKHTLRKKQLTKEEQI